MESESEVGSIATVPAIMVTPVSEVSEESAEQNVPVSQAHPESLDPETVELLEDVEVLKETEEADDQEVEVKERWVQINGLGMDGWGLIRWAKIGQKCSNTFSKRAS